MNVFILMFVTILGNGEVRETPITAYRSQAQCERMGRAALAHVQRQEPVPGRANVSYRCVRGYDL